MFFYLTRKPIPAPMQPGMTVIKKVAHTGMMEQSRPRVAKDICPMSLRTLFAGMMKMLYTVEHGRTQQRLNPMDAPDSIG